MQLFILFFFFFLSFPLVKCCWVQFLITLSFCLNTKPMHTSKKIPGDKKTLLKSKRNLLYFNMRIKSCFYVINFIINVACVYEIKACNVNKAAKFLFVIVFLFLLLPLEKCLTAQKVFKSYQFPGCF